MGDVYRIGSPANACGAATSWGSRGAIVCADGSSLGSVRTERLVAVADALAVTADVVEVDASSVFLVVRA